MEKGPVPGTRYPAATLHDLNGILNNIPTNNCMPISGSILSKY